MSNYGLAVDIGGTFTDVVVRSAAGRTWVDKTLTTPDNLDTGFFRAIDAILQSASTGKIGDGKIFVSKVDQAIRIRNQERGVSAL